MKESRNCQGPGVAYEVLRRDPALRLEEAGGKIEVCYQPKLCCLLRDQLLGFWLFSGSDDGVCFTEEHGGFGRFVWRG